MDGISKLLFIVLIILAIVALSGNGEMLMALINQDSSRITENGFFVFVAIVADLILAIWVIIKIMNPVLSSFRLAHSGLTRFIKEKKERSTLNDMVGNEELYLSRLEELKNHNVNKSAIIRTNNLCNLLSCVSEQNQTEELLKPVAEKMEVLKEINDIEDHLAELSEHYRKIGNTEKCVYCLERIDSERYKIDVDELKKDCKDQLELRGKEKKAAIAWLVIVSFAIVSLTVLIISIAVDSHFKSLSYKDLKLEIENKTLTTEMCNWKGKNNEGSYYDYIKTDRGKSIIADYLKAYQENDDIQSAMWLLYTTSEDDIMPSSFNKWIIEYGKANGKRSTNQEDDNDYWYFIYYELDEYVIITSSESEYEHLRIAKWNR